MIEKLKKVDNSDFPYLDENRVSFRTKSEYLQGLLGFCGCGNPDSVMVLVRDVLMFFQEKEDKTQELDMHLPTDGVYYFVLYTLNNQGLIEHGSSIGGSWLTDKGREILNDIEWCLKHEIGEKNND